MYTVKLLPSWTTGRALAQQWQASGQVVNTDRIRLLDLESPDAGFADFWVIINAPPAEIAEIPADMAARTVIFYMEPRRDNQPGNHGRKSWSVWATPDPARFLQVREFHHYPNNAEWHLSGDCLSQAPEKRYAAVVSAVVSDKRLDQGHRLRLDFLHYAGKQAPGLFKIWGRCASENFGSYQDELPPHEKDAALLPFRYTLAAENNSERNYFTEKIVDAIMAECLCFYWGCPNLAPDWLDEKCFYRVDLEHPVHALAEIQAAVTSDEWSQRLPHIRAMKEKIRRQLTLVPTLDRVLTAAHRHFMNDYFDRVVVINLDRSTDRWRTMVKQFEQFDITNYTRLAATDRDMAARMVKQGSWKLPTAHLGRPGIDRNAQLAQLACKISHWRAICLAKKKRWRRVLIIEDDAILSELGMRHFNLAMQETLDRALDWDLMWVFGLYYQTRDGYAEKPRDAWLSETIKDTGDFVHPLAHSCSTVCYGVDRGCYDQVLDAIETHHAFPIDDLFNHHLHSQLKSYIMLPCPVGADLENESTITGPEGRQTTQKTPNVPQPKRVVDLLFEQVREMLDQGETPYTLLDFWNARVRPHLISPVLDTSGTSADDIADLVTRLVCLFETGLDRGDLLDFLWNARSVDGLAWVDKVVDILHVTSYYADMDILSIRSASYFRRRLLDQPARLQELDGNAAFARRRFREDYERAATMQEKMQVCGFTAHVINLARRPDRLKTFRQRMDPHLEVQRFPAVDGASLKRNKRLEHLFRDNDFGFSRGVLGAALSHLELWKELLAGDSHNGVDTYLIFEDDVQLRDPFTNGQWLDMYYKLNTEHPDWDTCFLAFTPTPTEDFQHHLEDRPLEIVPLKPEMTWGGFAAYWINRKGAATLVKFIEEHGIRHAVDYILMRKPGMGLKNFLISPNPCFSQWVTSTDDGVDTDIQKSHAPW
uniref:Glycosyl transferase family 25 domain-containing protein n=1 Tax=viral metagenome TaxID=1070528 RepID=A0A6C0BLN4_9ZZZZ